MLSQNNFLGGLGSLEGSFLIGFASIIFSLAIAVIPFMAKRIVSGDVGSTAGVLIGAAVTALTAGTAAIEGAAVGAAAASAGGMTGATGNASNGSGAVAGGAKMQGSVGAGNQPVPGQRGINSGDSSSSAGNQPAMDTVALIDTEHNADSSLVHGVPPQSCRKVPRIFG
jgi:type IV secretory pathway TrbL component